MWLPSGFQSHSELLVRHSRFLTLLARTDDEEAARAAVAGERKRFPDARHHCSAFIVEVPGAQPVERSSDDGEPAGTAGTPMLEVLRGSGVTNATVVVTRWFGGVKLGTGGLVRAYSDAVEGALAAAPRVRPLRRSLFTLTLDHADAGRIQSELLARGVEVLDVAYADRATLTLSNDDDAALLDVVAHLTRGGASPSPAGTRVIEVPVPAPAGS